MQAADIITVGLNPVWDRTCYIDGIEWGDHTVIDSETLFPAGKALNISKALAWLSVPSTAAGIWGTDDYTQMSGAMSGYRDYIRPAFTVVKGKTRQNITVVDTSQHREMHLRSAKTLITEQAVKQLKKDLPGQLNPQASVIVAGSIPAETAESLIDEYISLIRTAGSQCAELIVDTSGEALAKIVNHCRISVIKPNLEELSALLGETVENNIDRIISAARPLCEHIRVVIVSLGRDGAVAVSKRDAVYCRVNAPHHRVLHTVGCGDYLLAGYVSVPNTAGIAQKLITGVKAATAKAWGWCGTKPWLDVQKDIDIEMTAL